MNIQEKQYIWQQIAFGMRKIGNLVTVGYDWKARPLAKLPVRVWYENLVIKFYVISYSECIDEVGRGSCL